MYALIIFLAASLTDALDGYIARRTNSITPIGRFLDPMADKLLLVSSYVALTLLKFMPAWMTVTVISRDVIIFFGWLGVYIITGVKTIKPSIISKATTAMQMITVILVLMYTNAKILNVVFMCTAVLTFISGLHYIIRTALVVSHSHD
jgi:cardiolipin synthase